MRRWALVLILLLLAGACGDDDTTPTATSGTTPPTAATTTATSPGDGGSTETTPAPTVPPPGGDVPDCLDIWPEALVQDVVGPDFTFFQANADRSACIYGAIPNSVALALRAGDLTNFELGRSASAGAGAVTDVPICDGGYFIELPGAGIIMEAFDAEKGRVYTATIAGTNIGDAGQSGEQLLGRACAG